MWHMYVKFSSVGCSNLRSVLIIAKLNLRFRLFLIFVVICLFFDTILNTYGGAPVF